MTSYLFFAIQTGIYYQQLKKPLNFASDEFGLNNWLLRFPLSIYSGDLREKHVFNEDSVSISSHNGGIEQERWKYLVLTQNDGKRLYCTAQVYYEKAVVNQCLKLNRDEKKFKEAQNQEFYLPKWLVFMSEQPYFKMQVNLLKIFRQLRKPNPNISHLTSQNAILQYLSSRNKTQPQLLQANAAENSNEVSTDQIIEYYLAKSNSHRGGDTILLQKHSNIPVLHLYHLEELTIFQFTHFFNLPLSNKTIATAIAAILLEKQLIVTSRSTNLNVMVIQSLLQIIRPLKWTHMLVHNLPSHLIEVANENFMPFIVGITKKDLQLLNMADKFVLIVDEDRIVKPEPLPKLEFDDFPNPTAADSSSHFAEKQVLEYSINFMCSLLQPLVRNRKSVPSENQEFYECFKQKTMLCDSFLQKYDSGKLKEFARLVAIQDLEQRKKEIQKKLSQLLYFIQHPKFLTNQTEWMKFYLSRKHHRQHQQQHQQPYQQQQWKDIFALRENRLLNFKESKKLTHNQNHRSISRVLLSNSKQHSVSNRRGAAGRPRSSQRLKLSIVRQQKLHPLMTELLQTKLGVNSRMG